jgi:site-specific DNA-methyltransferase (adenine-specific)
MPLLDSALSNGGEEVIDNDARRDASTLASRCSDEARLTVGQLSIGDAIEHAETLPGNSVDLVLFSPPYDGVRDYKGEWTIDLPALGASLLRVVKDGGFAVVVIADGTKDQRKSMTTFRTAVAWEDAGWSLFESVIYSRDGRPGAWWSTRFRVDHEHILMFYKGKRPRPITHHAGLRVPSKHAGKTWTGTQRMTDGSLIRTTATVAADKCRGTIWHYATSNTEGNKVKSQHPATFPDALARDLILALSDPGDWVYDPMMGSGTSVVVAAKEGRRWLGNDFSAEYVGIAQQRLAAEAGIPLVSILSTCCECGNDDVCQGYFYCSDCLEVVAS